MRRVALVLLVLVLAGCTAAPSNEETTISELMTSEEDMVLIAECLTDRGWTVRLEEGAIQADVPREQSAAYQADNLQCLREVGFDPDAELTEEEYRAVYAWHEEIAQCLEGAGWSTPEQPSFEVFRETYDTDPWIPWSEVEGKDLERATEACPVLDARR